ncbi:MAG TPA: polyphosphate:AMP phosphotransferase [Gemmatimonadaceae bacterium]|nr:polyphosphate:AMP phosphotransferase [Gemmatimonadaceae bacterium]
MMAPAAVAPYNCATVASGPYSFARETVSQFAAAELGHTVDKAKYEREEPKLREALLNAQFDLATRKAFPAIIVIGGVDGAGKGETVNLLNEWMDPRHIHTHAFQDPSDEEQDRPPMWRYWRALPPKGTIGILFGAWHTDPIVKRVARDIDGAELGREIDATLRFERMLVDEGALLIKLWFHLSKDRQRKRLRALEKNPLTRWRVTALDWKRFKMYDRFRRISERYLRETSTGDAPWTIIEGYDERYRSLTAGNVILSSLRARLQQPKQRGARKTVRLPKLTDTKDLIGSIDLTARIDKKRYEKQLERLQGKLNGLSRHRKFNRMSVIVVFEGPDAAGKGGAIRRVTGALDARQYQGIPIAAPTEEERAQPYLWRFWRHLPRLGRFTIYDRSWYGRVLVERVEGFCTESDWKRAYGEINDFEEQLSRSGAVVAKFWLQVSKAEQLKRFQEREHTSFKRFKITADDWRNRDKWDAYRVAADEMIERTSTSRAPWTLVGANDKYHARITVLRSLCAQIERALNDR